MIQELKETTAVKDLPDPPNPARGDAVDAKAPTSTDDISTTTTTMATPELIIFPKEKNSCVVPDCNKVYANAGSLKTHLIKVHAYTRIEFQFDVCMNTFDEVKKASCVNYLYLCFIHCSFNNNLFI